MPLSYNRSKKAQVIHDYQPDNFNAQLQGPGKYATPLSAFFFWTYASSFAGGILREKFQSSSLLTPEDLIPSSRGLRAEIKRRGLFLIPLIWAFIFWDSISSPVRLRVQLQQQSLGVLLLCSCAAKQHLSKHEEENLGLVLRHDYG